jgi:hypothetical protein
VNHVKEEGDGQVEPTDTQETREVNVLEVR